MSVCDLPNKIKIRTWRNGINKCKNEEIEKVNFVFIVFWTSGDMHQKFFVCYQVIFTTIYRAAKLNRF